MAQLGGVSAVGMASFLNSFYWISVAGLYILGGQLMGEGLLISH